MCDEAVEVAVVVEVGEDHAARGAFFRPAGLFGHVDEVGAFIHVDAVGFAAEDAAAAHVGPAVGVAVYVGVGEGDLCVPIPVVGADGFFFVVGVVGHAVGLDEVEAAVAVEVAEGRAPAESAFVEGVAAGGFVGEGGGVGLAGAAVIHPQQAAFGLQFFVDVGDVDVGAAVVVEIAEGGVHAFVGVAADCAGEAAFDGQEAFALLVEIQFVRAEVVGDVEVGVAVGV